MTEPLVSVVIPTAYRPAFLPRAVDSALAGMDPVEVEVIVVPNGPDTSWRLSLSNYAANSSVRVLPIEKGHANVARNHGLKNARGKYVRFLDDDDLMLPGARHQYELLESSNAEICSGPVSLRYETGKQFCIWRLPDTNDFVEGILTPERKTGPQFHVYRRSSIENIQWNETIDIGQDTHWIHNLCRQGDWDWVKTNENVCAWVHHGGCRISTGLGVSGHLKLQERLLWDTIVELDKTNRLTKNRYASAARGLWGLIHAAFFTDPVYWSGIIRKANAVFPDVYPDVSIYKYDIGKLFPPIALETLMTPKRWLNHLWRQYLIRKGMRAPW